MRIFGGVFVEYGDGVDEEPDWGSSMNPSNHTEPLFAFVNTTVQAVAVSVPRFKIPYMRDISPATAFVVKGTVYVPLAVFTPNVPVELATDALQYTEIIHDRDGAITKSYAVDVALK